MHVLQMFWPFKNNHIFFNDLIMLHEFIIVVEFLQTSFKKLEILKAKKSWLTIDLL